MDSQLALLGGQKLRVGLGEIQERGSSELHDPKVGSEGEGGPGDDSSESGLGDKVNVCLLL